MSKLLNLPNGFYNTSSSKRTSIYNIYYLLSLDTLVEFDKEYVNKTHEIPRPFNNRCFKSIS